MSKKLVSELDALNIWSSVMVDGKRVKGVAAGEHHTVAWTEAGEMFAWGKGTDGQLGLGALQQEVRVPRLVQALGQVVQVSTGDSCTVVRTAEGDVVAFGWNGSQGLLRLGRGLTPRAVVLAP